MDKLIALLDEYDGPELEHTIIDGNVKRRVKNIIEPDKPYKWSSVWWYSKSFGFIKWLVDNDKIDTQNLITYMNGTSLTFNKVPSTDCASIDKTWNKFYTECLLMLLSIQDNPIEFLVSILK